MRGERESRDLAFSSLKYLSSDHSTLPPSIEYNLLFRIYVFKDVSHA